MYKQLMLGSRQLIQQVMVYFNTDTVFLGNSVRPCPLVVSMTDLV